MTVPVPTPDTPNLGQPVGGTGSWLRLLGSRDWDLTLRGVANRLHPQHPQSCQPAGGICWGYWEQIGWTPLSPCNTHHPHHWYAYGTKPALDHSPPPLKPEVPSPAQLALPMACGGGKGQATRAATRQDWSSKLPSLTSLRSIGGEAEHFNPSHPLESVARGVPTVRTL